VVPDGLSLRQLRQMARGSWGPTASLMAAMYELHRDPARRSRPFGPADFDPFADDRPAGDGVIRVEGEGIAYMREAFEKGFGPHRQQGDRA
jgi:hypothetical protein